MLNILGSENPFPRGMDRRTAISVGSLGVASMNLPALLQYETLAAARQTGEFHIWTGQTDLARLFTRGRIAVRDMGPEA